MWCGEVSAAVLFVLVSLIRGAGEVWNFQNQIFLVPLTRISSTPDGGDNSF